LRLKERGYLPMKGVHILNATVSERAGRWFVSVQVEKELLDPKATYKPVVGVDLGILALAAISDGTMIENPHALKKDLHKIKHLQRVVSRRKKWKCQPRESGQAIGQSAPACCQCSQGCAAPGYQPADENQVSNRSGRPERERDGEEPPPGAGDYGCGILRIQTADGIQGPVVWLSDHPGRPVLPLHKALFAVWAHQGKDGLE